MTLSNPDYLQTLSPEWLQVTDNETPDSRRRLGDEEYEKAQGVIFLCPKCLRTNSGDRAGVHSIIIWFEFRGVPIHYRPGPARWVARGSGFQNLTLTGAPGNMDSINLTSGCYAHFFIRDGKILDA